MGRGVPGGEKRVKRVSHRPADRPAALLVGLSLVVAWASLGCAGDIATEGRGSALRFRHKPTGYRTPPPPSTSAFAWKRFDLEGTDLAFRAEAKAKRGTHLSLLSRCRQTQAKAPILARRLAGGVPSRDFLSTGPVSVSGREGFSQTFRAAGDTRVKTLTVVEGRCTFDWLLVANPADFAAAEPLFDRWWASFVFGASR